VLLATGTGLDAAAVEYCDFLYGGSTGNTAALRIERAGITISHVSVQYSGAGGLVTSFFATIQDSLFASNAQDGVWVVK
jgi:hypothetical protein